VSHLTAISADSGPNGERITHVWFPALSDKELTDLAATWRLLPSDLFSHHTRGVFQLYNFLHDVATPTEPAPAPIWDESFEGTFDDFTLAAEAHERALAIYEEAAEEFLTLARGALFTCARSLQFDHADLDFGRVPYFQANKSEVTLNGPANLALSTHAGDLYAHAPEIDLPQVLNLAMIHARASSYSARTANAVYIAEMTPTEVLRHTLQGEAPEEALEDASDLTYAEFMAVAAKRRAYLLELAYDADGASAEHLSMFSPFGVYDPSEHTFLRDRYVTPLSTTQASLLSKARRAAEQ
jgi:hypothetical protein